MKEFYSVLAVVAAAAAMAADPVVSGVEMTQAADGPEVTITYRLANGPAVVTFDVGTEEPDGWHSIGGERLRNTSAVSDVWREVSGKEVYTIIWRPDRSCFGNGLSGPVKAKVSAWKMDDLPDYMVVDLTDGSDKSSRRFYPSAEFLPGGLLGNFEYRQSKLVMRKIMAKDVEWRMGSVSEPGRNSKNEMAHTVRLGANYYIGVFPMTQMQWLLVAGYNRSCFSLIGSQAMRPVEYVSFNEVRCAPTSASADQTMAYVGGEWPDDPYAGSFLDKLRKRTGIDFDLPSEAQWEFACRAGYGDGFWGDGSPYSAPTATTDRNIPGRYRYNGGYIPDGPDGTYTEAGGVYPKGATTDERNASALVGSYAPNAWGLYDMHGNMFEMCLDWYADDITALNGAVNTTAGTERVRKGGGWHVQANNCRAALRLGFDPTTRTNSSLGFRVVCPVK